MTRQQVYRAAERIGRFGDAMAKGGIVVMAVVDVWLLIALLRLRWAGL